MSWLSEMFSGSVGTIIEKLGDAIDKNVTSDEERLALSNALARLESEAGMEAARIELAYEAEITKRHTSDMVSDDAFSKRVRPFSMVFLLAVVTVLALTDGNIVVGDYTFEIQKSYVDLFQVLLTTSFAFYFGGRSFEKISKIKNIKKGTSK